MQIFLSVTILNREILPILSIFCLTTILGREFFLAFSIFHPVTISRGEFDAPYDESALRIKERETEEECIYYYALDSVYTFRSDSIFELELEMAVVQGVGVECRCAACAPGRGGQQT